MPRAPELNAQRISVAAGILIDGDDRLLLTDRSRARTMQEFWEFPGGKLGVDESAEDALHRELGEELGIEVTSFSHFHAIEHDYTDLHVSIDFFLVTAWRGTPSGTEGQALQWLLPEEIAPDILLPADKPVLERLSELQDRR